MNTMIGWILDTTAGNVWMFSSLLTTLIWVVQS